MARKNKKRIRSRPRAEKKSRTKRPTTARRSRPARFPPEVRQKALELILRRVPRRKIAAEIGCSTETLRLWARAAEKELAQKNAAGKDGTVPAGTGGTQSVKSAPTAPKDPGAGLSEMEVSAILDYKRRYPTMGPAQLRAQLKRFKGWRLSNRAIARVLRQNGYELEHRGGRPEEPKPPESWEAPQRNALWQIDFTEVRIPEGRRALGVVLDDFSRFIVSWGLFESPTSKDVVAMLAEGIRLHGKPEAIYTDRAGPFLAWGKPEGLQRFLDRELIDHHTTRAYRPQGRGKVEAVLATIKRELWEVEHFAEEVDARRALERFVARYNHRRAHLSLEGLTPADRFFGRWESVLALVEGTSRKRQGIEALRERTEISKEIPADDRSEILRLVAAGGELELRFFGHRVRLGRIES
jgi:putative transposase